MVSESWETVAQVSIFFNLCMIFEPGLTKIQDGGEIPIGSH